MGVVVEEADETVFWLELICESGLLHENQLQMLLREANELLRIFSASYQTARSKHPV
jgi:four helix bundle protein